MNYRTAEFRLGREIANPKGVAVFVPGSNQDGRDFPYYKNIKKWANENQCATVGCFFEDIDPNQIEGYADAKGGSGDALLNFIDKNGLGHLPIYLWGFSAGGQFSYEMACYVPKRVAAFVVNKGGFYYTALAPIETRKLPARFFVGQRDDMSRQYIVIGIYLMNRRDDACEWELFQEPVGHSVGESMELGLELFSETIKKREG